MEDAGRSFDETAIWEYCWRDSHNYRWGRFRRGDQCFHWQYKVRALVSNAARALSIPPSRANNQTAEPEMPLMRCLRESSPMGVSTFILIFFFKKSVGNTVIENRLQPFCYHTVLSPQAFLEHSPNTPAACNACAYHRRVESLVKRVVGPFS